MYSEAAATSRSVLAIAAGIALGAGLMFLLDPRSGRRRRALLSDQVTRGLKGSRDFSRKVGTDARNRASGLYQQARSAVQREATDEEQQAEGAAESGRAREPEYLQDNWSPAPRVFAGAMGLGLLATGFSGPRSSATSAALSATGAALLLRAAIKRPVTRQVSFGADAEQGFMIQKAVEVYAEVDEVYGAWRALENFPQFMTHVREVTPIGERRYRWVVDGPAGVAVTWDAEITNDIPNEVIAWRTVPEAPVQSSGEVRFEPTSTGGTRIQVRMWYRPPANLVGHAAAWMFGRDPKHQMDEDLLRFKSFLETGTAARAQDSALRH